ncbi:branched-chain amino acid ABC transporter permease [Rhizobium leguminosarum]|uniref:branched-chain amino acid ABC transporter permease n=1 Tax=Rhizobium leguminosarum TaxID=384 RepID=UPI0004271B97|nr:branched-chain amino acid ABC transporter permease [Rhizobium leguminosarum]UIJ83270.1 branched-chain amino acid ABC transporter permease [Rhizobium leguminosarum]
MITTLVVGLVLGGTYALMALGLTIQYGVSRIMNLAYGEFVIGGSFLTYLAVSAAGLNPFMAFLLVVPFAYLASYVVYAVIMQPLEKRSKGTGRLEVDSILVTFGLMFLLQGVYLSTFGSGFTGYNWLEAPIDVFGTKISTGRLVGALLAVIIGGALYVAIQRTRWGMAMRAVASRPGFAPLVGINNQRQARSAFAVGGALAAAGGVVLSMYQPFTPTDGVFLTMKALVVVIMGGVGNLAGAMAAGLILGLVEAGVSAAVDPGLTLAATYAIFLAVLLWRPNGLFS